MARNRYYDDEATRKGIDGHLFKRLLSFCKPYKKRFAICVLIVLVSVGLSLLAPQVSKWMIDDVYPNYDVTGAFIVVGLLAGISIVEKLISMLRGVLITKLGQTIVYDIRKAIFYHLQELSFNYFDDLPTGKILVRVTSYIDGLAGLLSSNLVTIIADIATLIGVVIIMLIMNPILTVVSFVTVLPLMVFIVLFRRKLEKLRIPVINKVSNRNAYIHENIMGVYTAQAFNREQENSREFVRLNEQVKDTYMHQVKWSTLMWPVIDLTSVASLLVLYIVGYIMITGDVMTAGEIMAFATYVSKFWTPINSLSSIYSQIVSTMANVEKIFSTIDTPPEITDESDAIELPTIKGDVTFDHVSFAYETGNLVLDDVSFKVKAGQTIALVGPTGAGKTTIVNLISRFYDATDGSVLIDGYNIKHVKLHSLRRQVTAMMQDSFVFSGNIIENIRYGRPDATDEECIAAARTVHADEFIERLPDGYYTRVEERGAGLSAGEKQLLSFARIVLADPRIIILDEATSAIDTKTELLVQKALASLLKGRTSFVIAHRLSTIRNADCIMVISNKGIAEHGTHEELLEQKGLYYELNLSQLSGLDA
ncbi:MAG: ABC transporter ATP-binding protein [Firmicutes bacterium]|nr:ABC transporter ATP-binding protein [Bacillota bacterium]